MDRARLLALAAYAVGGLFVLFGAVAHNVYGLPPLLEAARTGALGLPSNREVGLGLTQETVATAWFLMGVEQAALGVVLILLAPALARGDALARRVVLVLALFFVAAYTAPWLVLEHAVPRPLPVPALGALLLVLLYRSRARPA